MKSWISTVLIAGVAVVVGLPGQWMAARKGTERAAPVSWAALTEPTVLAALGSEPWPSQRFMVERQDVNRRAQATRQSLELQPADWTQPCTDNLEPAHDRDADGGITLRPGQELVLRGCFGDAPGEVSLRGVAAGELDLTLLAWSPHFVHLRVPDLGGVPDRDAAWLRVRAAGGQDLGLWPTRFRARRAMYAVVGDAVQAHLATPLRVDTLALPADCTQPSIKPSSAGSAAIVCDDGAAHAGVAREPITLWPRGAQQHVVGVLLAPRGPGLRAVQGLWLDAPVGLDGTLGLPSARLQAHARRGLLPPAATAVAQAGR
jgi:hypothetical protein